MAYRNLGDIYGPIENQVEELSKSGWKIARFKKIPLIVAYNDLRLYWVSRGIHQWGSRWSMALSL